MNIDISKKPEGHGDKENFIPRNYEKYSENMEDISGKIQRVHFNLIFRVPLPSSSRNISI
jgi:hypothetical protein